MRVSRRDKILCQLYILYFGINRWEKYVDTCFRNPRAPLTFSTNDIFIQSHREVISCDLQSVLLLLILTVAK